MEKKVMNGLLFRCQHEECEEKIPYGQYFAHLRTKCTVKKHKKVQLPEGAFGPQKKVEEHKNPYFNIFVVGDLNKLFLEEGEELSDELREQNEDEGW